MQSLLRITLSTSLLAAAAAQEGRLVLDARADIPGVGPLYTFNGDPDDLEFDARVWDDGTWFASAAVVGNFGASTVGFVLLEDGTPILTDQDLMPDGRLAEILSIYEAEGNQLLLKVGSSFFEGGLYRYTAGGPFELLVETGSALDAVNGLAPGTTLAGFVSAELMNDGSLLGRASVQGGDTGTWLLSLDAAGGVVTGGEAHVRVDGPPPSGVGNNVQFLCDAPPCYGGNAAGTELWSCIVQPFSRHRVYKDGLVYAEDGDEPVPGVTYGNVWSTSAVDVSPDGGILFAAATLLFPSPSTDTGILLRDDVPFVWEGASLPGGGTAKRVLWRDAHLLSGDLVSWVERDPSAAPDVDSTLYVEFTPVLAEGSLRVLDRYPQDLLEEGYRTSPGGRYVVTSANLQPGNGLVWIDLLGSPEPPGQLGPDAFEPNDLCAQASFMGTDLGPDEWLVDERTLTCLVGSPDFYTFNLGPEREVDITLRSDAFACDLDLLVHSDSCATLLGSDLDAEDDPHVFLSNPTGLPIQVVVEVRYAAGESYAVGVYDLVLEARNTPVCPTAWTEEPFEADGNSTVTAPILVPGTYQDLLITENDTDWLGMHVPAFSTVTVTVEHPETAASLAFMNALLLRQNGVHILGSGGGSTVGNSPARLILTWTNDNPDLWPGGTPQTLPAYLRVLWFRNETSTACSLYDVTIELDPPLDWTAYCGPARANSTGGSARVLPSGSASIPAADLQLAAVDLPANQFGYFLVSLTQDFVPLVGTSQGNLCLGGAIGRYVAQVQNSGAAGVIHLAPAPLAIPTPGMPVAAQPGETWSFQCWYRDLNPNATSNFTSGLAVTYQ